MHVFIIILNTLYNIKTTPNVNKNRSYLSDTAGLLPIYE